MEKKTIKRVSFIVAIIFIFNLQFVYGVDEDGIKDSINTNKDKIEELENEKDGLEQKKNGIQDELDELLIKMENKSKDLNSSSNKVNEFQGEIDTLQAGINSLQSQIDEKNRIIKEKEEIIKQKELEKAETEEALGARLRSYYKLDLNTRILYMFLNSTGIGDIISNFKMVNDVIDYDNQLLDDIENLKGTLEAQKSELQESANKLNEEKREIYNQQQELKNAQSKYINEKNKYQQQLNELQALESEKNGLISSLDHKEKQIADEIGDLVSYNEELQKELDGILNNINNGSNNSEVSKDKNFIVPTVGPITSPYGTRYHPITGESGFHTGIDYGAPYGADILASKSGKVVYAGVMGGYGNTVLIDHGGGYQTLYAHSSSLNVSYGQEVKQGQVVAFIGSTGMSTGPHLHFEIRKNGAHVNPADYLYK